MLLCNLLDRRSQYKYGFSWTENFCASRSQSSETEKVMITETGQHLIHAFYSGRLPMWHGGKESTANVGVTDSIPGWGRSHRRGNGNPLQYSCVKNSMDRGAWRGRKVSNKSEYTQYSEQADMEVGLYCIDAYYSSVKISLLNYHRCPYTIIPGQCFSDMVPYCPSDSKYTLREEGKTFDLQQLCFSIFYVVNFHKIVFKESFTSLRK